MTSKIEKKMGINETWGTRLNKLINKSKKEYPEGSALTFIAELNTVTLVRHELEILSLLNNPLEKGIHISAEDWQAYFETYKNKSESK
jgi:hypothetical protein